MTLSIMSAEHKHEMTDLMIWFKQHFPAENHLAGEIAERLSTILEAVKVEGSDEEEIFFRVGRDPVTHEWTLMTTEFGAIFLGAMSRAILEALTAQLEGLLQSGAADPLIKQKIKEVFSTMVQFSTTQQSPDGTVWLECSNCKGTTPANGKFCKNCGITIK